jgi:hypothetical protein
MAVTLPKGRPWLLFMFQLPSRNASQRVTVWRKLQKYGALAWRNSAYVLPNNSQNLEKFEWLAKEVRKYRGEASILEVAKIEDTPDKQIIAQFNAARSRDYEDLLRGIRLASRARPGKGRGANVRRFKQRLSEIEAIDAFACGRRIEVEAALEEIIARGKPAQTARASGIRREDYQGRTWMTRPRPEVDRVGSGWLIKHFIDPRAKFVFSATARPGVVRFDMFEGEFTHVGDECTFETLLKRFQIKDRQLRRIAEIIHDADLEDNKFGRNEGAAIELVLKGWAKMDWPDDQIMERGFALFDALYLILTG